MLWEVSLCHSMDIRRDRNDNDIQRNIYRSFIEFGLFLRNSKSLFCHHEKFTFIDCRLNYSLHRWDNWERVNKINFIMQGTSCKDWPVDQDELLNYGHGEIFFISDSIAHSLLMGAHRSVNSLSYPVIIEILKPHLRTHLHLNLLPWYAPHKRNSSLGLANL